MIRTLISSVIEGAVKLFSGTGRVGEAFTEREYFQHYGFTSRPLSGAEGIALTEGNRVFLIASEDRRYRVAIEAGEVCLYTDEGVKLHFKRNKVVSIEGADEIQLGGTTGLNRLIDERVKAIFDAHVHLGVTTGAGTSGVPTVLLDLSACSTTITKGK